jgi:nitrate/nitrite transporter NarK
VDLARKALAVCLPRFDVLEFILRETEFPARPVVLVGLAVLVVLPTIMIVGGDKDVPIVIMSSLTPFAGASFFVHHSKHKKFW